MAQSSVRKQKLNPSVTLALVVLGRTPMQQSTPPGCEFISSALTLKRVFPLWAEVNQVN